MITALLWSSLLANVIAFATFVFAASRAGRGRAAAIDAERELDNRSKVHLLLLASGLFVVGFGCQWRPDASPSSVKALLLSLVAIHALYFCSTVVRVRRRLSAGQRDSMAA